MCNLTTEIILLIGDVTILPKVGASLTGVLLLLLKLVDLRNIGKNKL
jgi:hypothetical protein